MGRALQAELDFGDVVYVEANLERYFQIWLPVSRTHPLVRNERVIKLDPNGDAEDGSKKHIVITPTVGYSAYNITSKNVFYALIMLWLEKGAPTEPWKISMAGIARKMGRSVGKKVLSEIRHHLDSLAFTNVRFVDCFKVKNSDGDVIEAEKNLRILSMYDPQTKKDKNGNVKNAGAVVQFHESVLNSLNSGNVIPANVSTFISITCPIAAYVFMKFDNILTDLITKKQLPFREWKIDELLAELSLQNEHAYKYASWKEKLAQRIVKTLDGANLSMEGVKLKLSYGLTSKAIKAMAKGEKEPAYKLIFETTGTPKKKEALPFINNEYMADSLVDHMIDACGQIMDPLKTVNTFTKMAKQYPPDVIYRAVSETRDAIQTGERTGNPVSNKPGFLVSKIKAVYKDATDFAKRNSKKPALVFDD